MSATELDQAVSEAFSGGEVLCRELRSPPRRRPTRSAPTMPPT